MLCKSYLLEVRHDIRGTRYWRWLEVIMIEHIKMMQNTLTYSQCWKSASCKQFRSLALKPKTPFARSKTVILQENNLPVSMYWLFSSTDFGARYCTNAEFKCSSIDNCHPSKLKHQWVISYQWPRSWAEHTISIWNLSKLNIASKNKGREAWHTYATAYIS